MIRMKNIFTLLRLRDLHLIGVFLCLSIIVIPTTRVFLYPFTGNSLQPFLFYTLISLVEILFIVIFIIERKRKNYQLNHLPNSLWGAFFIWAVAAVFNLPEQINGTFVTLIFAIHFFFFVTLSSYLKCQPEAGRQLIASLILSILLFLPFFWLRLQATYDQQDFDWALNLPGYSNVRHLDYFLGSIITLLGLWPLTNRKQKTQKTFPYLIFSLLLALWIMLLWTGGRGAAIAAAAAIGTLLIFFRPTAWKQLLLLNFTALVLGASLSLLLPIPSGSYGLLRFASKIDTVQNFTAGRSGIWAEAINVWTQHLWFGVGAGQTKTIIKAAAQTFGHPHNIFIQTMLAWGIIGGIPFLAGIFGIFWIKGKEFYYAVEQSDMISFIAYGVALSIVVNALVDGTLYYPFPLFIFTIAVSITGIKRYKSII